MAPDPNEFEGSTQESKPLLFTQVCTLLLLGPWCHPNSPVAILEPAGFADE